MHMVRITSRAKPGITSEGCDDDGDIERLHELCAVYTKKEITSCILDLAGWTSRHDLTKRRLLEPCAGEGVFVVEAATRLIRCWMRKHGESHADQLLDRIVAFEISPTAVSVAKKNVLAALLQLGLPRNLATRLCQRWVRRRDFLTTPVDGSFTHVVGNPPYIRWCNLPTSLVKRYSAIFPPFIAKGDLCVPFIHRCSNLLNSGGVLAFVCSDRWLRTAYGEALRTSLSSKMATVAHIEVGEISPFEKAVSTYPAITMLRRIERRHQRDHYVHVDQPKTLEGLTKAVNRIRTGTLKQLSRDPLQPGPWVHARRAIEKTLERIATRFPMIEEAGCRIRVGAAMGFRPAFVGSAEDLNVEKELLVPLVCAKDVEGQRINWCNRYVINVFDPAGGMRQLEDWPRLKERLEIFRTELVARACVRNKKDKSNWYRTIDRIDPAFAGKRKILIPELSRKPRLAIEDSGLHPDNSIYAITSEEWPIDLLHLVLSSGIVGLFVEAYSHRVNGGYLRFHRHFLRHVRIPNWNAIDFERMKRLRQLVKQDEPEETLREISALYGVRDNILMDFT